MIEMGVDIVYPVELPSQASLTIEGQNCFEPVVCKFSQLQLKMACADDDDVDSEFKECLTEFIRDFKTTKMHSLAEIINFNLEHPELCLPPRQYHHFFRPTSILTPHSMPRSERSHGRPARYYKARRDQRSTSTPPNSRRPRRPRLPLHLPATRYHHRTRRRTALFYCSSSRLPHRRMSLISAQAQRPTLRYDAGVTTTH